VALNGPIVPGYDDDDGGSDDDDDWQMKTEVLREKPTPVTFSTKITNWSTIYQLEHKYTHLFFIFLLSFASLIYVERI
jgi:hypothetical protein